MHYNERYWTSWIRHCFHFIQILSPPQKNCNIISMSLVYSCASVLMANDVLILTHSPLHFSSLLRYKRYQYMVAGSMRIFEHFSVPWWILETIRNSVGKYLCRFPGTYSLSLPKYFKRRHSGHSKVKK